MTPQLGGLIFSGAGSGDGTLNESEAKIRIKTNNFDTFGKDVSYLHKATNGKNLFPPKSR